MMRREVSQMGKYLDRDKSRRTNQGSPVLSPFTYYLPNTDMDTYICAGLGIPSNREWFHWFNDRW